MKVKVDELSGVKLDWMVALCEEITYYCQVIDGEIFCGNVKEGYIRYNPSSNWSQGGPIIERELIDIQSKFNSGNNIVPTGQWYWQASTVNKDDVSYWFDGPTPLIAAMRCYVASILGDCVDIPYCYN